MLEGCHSLSECETLLSKELQRVGLIGEIPLVEADVSRLADDISEQLAYGIRCVEERGPVSFMCLIVQIGILDYRMGEFWPAVAQRVRGFEPGLQVAFGRLFLRLLRKYDLPLFDVERALTYVTPVLGHGLIPNHCLEEFFAKVLEPMVRKDLTDPTDPGEVAYELRTLRQWNEAWESLESRARGLAETHDAMVHELRALELLREIRHAQEQAGDPTDLLDLPEDYPSHAARVEAELKAVQSELESHRRTKSELSVADSRYTPRDRSLVEHSAEIQQGLEMARELSHLGADIDRLQGQEVALMRELERRATPLLTEPWNEEHERRLAALPLAELVEQLPRLADLDLKLLEAGEQLDRARAVGAAAARARTVSKTVAVAMAALGLGLLALIPGWAAAGLFLLAAAAWKARTLGRDRREHEQALQVFRAHVETVAAARNEIQGHIELGLTGLPLRAGYGQDLGDKLASLTETYRTLDLCRRHRAELEGRLRGTTEHLSRLAAEIGVDPGKDPGETAGILERLLQESEERAFDFSNYHIEILERIDPAIAALDQKHATLSSALTAITDRVTAIGAGDLQRGIQKHAERRAALVQVGRLRAELERLPPHARRCELHLRQEDASSFHSHLNRMAQDLEGRLGDTAHRLRPVRCALDAYPHVFLGVDEPIRRFLLHGAETAERFLIQSVRLAHAVMTGQPGQTLPGDHLPARVKDAFHRWWRSRESATDRERLPGASTAVQDQLTPPALQFHPATLEIVAVLPAQVLAAPHSSDGDLTFEMVGSGTQELSVRRRVRAYRISSDRVETETVELPLPAPAQDCRLRLVSSAGELASWVEPGLHPAHPCLMFSKQGRRVSELTPGLHWLVVAPGFCLTPTDTGIMESGTLYGSWRDCWYYCVDLAQTAALSLVSSAGEHLPLPIRQEPTPAVQLVGTPLPEVTCNGHEVYAGEPPVLVIQPELEVPLDLWRVDLLPGPESFPQGARRCTLAEIGPPKTEGPDGICHVHLDDAQLLGPDAVGRFSIRVRGPNGQDFRFRIGLLPNLRLGLGSPAYPPTRASDEPILVTLACSVALEFTPALPARVEQGPKGILSIKTDPDESTVHGTLRVALDEFRGAQVPLHIRVPRIQWRLQGAVSEDLVSWQNRMKELWIGLWDNPGDLHLAIRVPGAIQGHLQLRVRNSTQSAHASLRNSEARFDLHRFSDTLRESSAHSESPSVRTFVLTSSDPRSASTLDEVPLFHVRVRWEVTNLQCEQSTRAGERVLVLRWTEHGQAEQRAVRLWRLTRTTHPMLSLGVEPWIFHAEIRASVRDLPPGQYLLEIARENPWQPGTAVFPGPGAPNTLTIAFEHTLGDGESDETGQVIIGIAEPHSGDEKGEVLHHLRDRYVISCYPQREGLPPNQYLGRVRIVRQRGHRQEVAVEDPVTFEYDPLTRRINFLEDKDGDGALFCVPCRKIFWSQEEQMLERARHHRLMLPDRFVLTGPLSIFPDGVHGQSQRHQGA